MLKHQIIRYVSTYIGVSKGETLFHYGKELQILSEFILL